MPADAKRCGRSWIHHLFGKGGMGEVYREDAKLGRVLKAFLPERSTRRATQKPTSE
jgi:hypothetical protein